ncbi:MAG TPA: SCO family protein [Vicinamibacterales bacterium]
MAHFGYAARRRPAIRSLSGLLPVLVAVLAGGCRQDPPVRQYTVIGQVITVQPSPPRLTIKHEDIEGFMPAMTMPFEVRDAALLERTKAGDLVRATLNVQGVEAWISAIEVTGHAPLPEAPPPVRILDVGDTVPDVELVNASGEPLTLSTYRGHPVVLTFTYTRCPFQEFCPAIDQRFLVLQRAIGRDASLAGVRLLTVSLDPEYDRPPVLRAHAEKLGVNRDVWELATGDAEVVLSFGRQLGLDVQRTGDTAADITHNLRTIVIGPDGRIAAKLSGADWDTATVLETLRGLVQS